jgi:hypothetical protein
MFTRDLVQAQRITGHSDPKLTVRSYTHVGVEEVRAVGSLPGMPEEGRRLGA